jgi:GAF domain-containing protein
MIRMPGGDLSRQMASPAVDIAPNDPIVAYFLSAPGAVEIDKLHLESPSLRALRAAGVKLVVPLVSQGELVGLLNLGPHLSEQDYSTDDRVLLNNLAIQAALPNWCESSRRRCVRVSVSSRNCAWRG